MSANHIYHNGEYVGFVWTTEALTGEVQWFCEDLAGEKMPGYGQTYKECWDWIVARAEKRDAA